MNFHHGDTLGAPSEEELLFKFLLVVLCPVVPKKALQFCFRKQRGKKVEIIWSESCLLNMSTRKMFSSIAFPNISINPFPLLPLCLQYRLRLKAALVQQNSGSPGHSALLLFHTYCTGDPSTILFGTTATFLINRK